MAEIDLLQDSPKHERVPLDTPFFRAYRGVYLNPKDVPPHYHDEVEILLSEGLAGESWVSGRKFPFQRKSVQVIPPGAIHSFKVRPQGDGSIFVVQLNTERCAALLRGYPEFNKQAFKNRLYSLPVDVNGLREELLSAALTLSPFRGGAVPIVESALSDLEIIAKLLRILLEGSRRTTPPVPGDERLRRILDAMEADLGKPFSLDRLSKTASLSKYHLCRFFRKSTGMTLTGHLAHLRAQKAGQLMLEQGLNVTQAALETGFESISYFIKVFRKVMGQTPKQWLLTNKTLQ